MVLRLSTIISRNDQLMTTPVDDELVVLSLASNRYLALDDIGRRIWELLETTQPISALCAQLSTEFHGTPEQITADVLLFLNELSEEGLVHVVNEGAG